VSSKAIKHLHAKEVPVGIRISIKPKLAAKCGKRKTEDDALITQKFINNFVFPSIEMNGNNSEIKGDAKVKSTTSKQGSRIDVKTSGPIKPVQIPSVQSSQPNSQSTNSNAPAQVNSQVKYSYTSQFNSALEDENRILKEALNSMRDEVEKLRAPSLMVAEVTDVLAPNRALIKIPNGNKFFVTISSSVKGLEAGDTVLVEQKNLNIVDKINVSKNFDVERFVIIEKPKTTWDDVGGLKDQVESIKEVVELPLKRPELFKKLGIQPPKGILLYGPPGTGKTLLAKAVANSTDTTFIEIVGSEIVQKFIGDGAKLIKEIFQLAKSKAPAIVFIDEIDALCAKRIELGTSGEREVQRTFMQLLAELDGFKPLDNVKIIGCTNRKDILDPAILRPGRLDRLIEVPNPDKEGIKQIYNIHLKTMPIEKKVNLDKIYDLSQELSGAEIRAVATEAGYHAIRDNRDVVTEEDFVNAILKVRKEEDRYGKDYVSMFG
jgi:proteasome regulatory subunit